MTADLRPRIVVFDPSPFLTVTIEGDEGGTSEIHVHAGGQGFWVARMAATLGARATLCGPFGGEPGFVMTKLIPQEDVLVESVPMSGANGVRIYDRRSGERREFTEALPRLLSRHEVDDLYNAMLAKALEADLVVLTGPAWPARLPPDIYSRLSADLAALGVPRVADLAGDALTAALSGGLTMLKVSHQELLDDGRAQGDDDASLVAGMRSLVDDGAAAVLVSKADAGALALVDGVVLACSAPRLTTVDHRGAGDSLTAGLAVSLAAKRPVREAIRLGLAAGAVNVTRRGLATGDREAIERFVEHVHVREIPSERATVVKRGKEEKA